MGEIASERRGNWRPVKDARQAKFPCQASDCLVSRGWVVFRGDKAGTDGSTGDFVARLFLAFECRVIRAASANKSEPFDSRAGRGGLSSVGLDPEDDPLRAETDD